MLDIGGGPGLIGQVFKASGRVRAVDDIEILDFRDAVSLDRIRAFLQLIQIARSADSSPNAVTARQWLSQQVAFMESTFPFPVNQHSNFLRVGPHANLGLDRFILGDLFELNETYDFLVGATTMQHFSVPTFLSKAHALLEPGGVLFIWNAYWYWALIVIQVFGDFPWAVQRLAWEDFTRYLKEYQPDQVENARLSVETSTRLRSTTHWRTTSPPGRRAASNTSTITA
jgi:hypothetical protein